MFKKMKEKDRVTIATRVRNEIASKICLIMEIVSGIRKIRTSRLRQRDGNGQDGGRSVRRMFRVRATKSEGMRTYGNFGKRPDYKGNGGKWRGMVRTT